MKQPNKLIIGIDDAGRGPVIGPMVLAGVLLNSDLEKEFKKLGVRDSKMLSSKKRELLAEIIREKSISSYITLTFPSEIDKRTEMGTNLNKIEAVKAAEIIDNLNSFIKNKKQKIKVVLDCPSPNIQRWQNYLIKHINSIDNLEVSCEHKADKNHVSVSAASIIAKSKREQEVEKIKKKIGKDFGSGYPSDPITKEFLEKYFKEHKKDGIFRETWGTVKEYKKQKSQKKLLEF